jgi:C_GCAxxG_C_C family probable redox protein
VDTKHQRAVQDHQAGFNCAQSVLKQFSNELGLTEEQALLLASGFGSGFHIGSVCGALAGGVMALGLALGFVDPHDKARINEATKDLVECFKDNVGEIECRYILGLDITDAEQKQKAREEGIFEEHCDPAISLTVRKVQDILHRHMEHRSALSC